MIEYEALNPMQKLLLDPNTMGQSINRGMTGTFPSRSAAESAIRKSLISGESRSEYSVRKLGGEK
jgi:hypothetical protein